MNAKSCILIIPIYNGAHYLDQTFQELEDFFDTKAYVQHIIFVNDGSIDDTASILDGYKGQLPIQTLHLSSNRGKGAAIAAAIEQYGKDCEFIAFTDIELPYGLQVVEDTFHYLHNNGSVEVVIGNRKVNDIPQYSRYRAWTSKQFRMLLPKSIRHISDTQCGMKVFRSYSAQVLFSSRETSRWVFDIELLLTATKYQMPIIELPVNIKESCKQGSGGVSLLQHGPKIFMDIMKIRKNEKQGKYNPALL